MYISEKTLEMHSSKQMTVYEQIIFFIKIPNFQNLILWWKIDFWAWKWVPGHARTVPDLEKPGKRTENPEKPPELLSAMAGPIVNIIFQSRGSLGGLDMISYTPELIQKRILTESV